MIAITPHAHDLLTLNLDNYAAQGCANTAIAALGSGFALRHTQTIPQRTVRSKDKCRMITFIEQWEMFIEESCILFGE